MPLRNPYCQITDIRDQLGDEGAKLDPDLIERAINATSRAIERHCGRRFWADPTPIPRLYVATRPRALNVADISTTTNLMVETDRSAAGAWTALDTSAYHLEPLNADADGPAYAWRRIVIDAGPPFPVHPRRPLVCVTARWGWSALPDDIAEAAILKATSLFKRREAPFGVAGFGEFGAVRITRADPDVVELLEPYVPPAVA